MFKTIYGYPQAFKNTAWRNIILYNMDQRIIKMFCQHFKFNDGYFDVSPKDVTENFDVISPVKLECHEFLKNLDECFLNTDTNSIYETLIY